MPQSDVSGNGNTTSQGVLDQRDLNAVNAALARSQAKQAAKQKEQSNQQQDSATNPKF
jgi:sRNA-binding protein